VPDHGEMRLKSSISFCFDYLKSASMATKVIEWAGQDRKPIVSLNPALTPEFALSSNDHCCPN
jgi:hypothetical protein